MRIILSLAVVTQTLSDILVPLLFVVVGWYVKVNDSRLRRKVRMEGDSAYESEDESSDESSSESSSSSDDDSSDEGDDSDPLFAPLGGA